MTRLGPLMLLLSCGSPEASAPPPTLTTPTVDVHFDEEGALLAAPGQGDGLRLTTRSWGRAGVSPRVLEPAWRAEGDRAATRIVTSSAGISEWWVADGAEIRQGWTVHERLSGQAPLEIVLALPGAALEVEPTHLVVHDVEGGRWTVRSLAAWDHTGRRLPVSFEADPDGYRIRLDDRLAAYPLTIDPVYAPASTRLEGSGSVWELGTSLSAAGDVNGDGYDDIVAGAPSSGTGTGLGFAAVYLGGFAGVIDRPEMLVGSTWHGLSVSGGGDLNGDGLSDVIVGGAEYAETYLGEAAGVGATASTTLTGAGSVFGGAVAHAGDVDGDGLDDVLVGAEGGDLAYLYLGDRSGTLGAAATTLAGAVSFGAAVAGAGDMNGDGYDEVVIGAPDADTVSLYVGSTLGLSATPLVDLLGSGSFGAAVSGAGDINADGYADLIVGAPGANLAELHLGAAAGPDDVADTTLSGSGAFGTSVSGAGDVDYDGYDDVIVGSPFYTAWGTGVASVFSGSVLGLNPTASAVLSESGSYDDYGVAVAGAGDINGDGVGDVMVGAPDARHSLPYGVVTVYHGWADHDGDGVPRGDDCDDDDPAASVEGVVYVDADGDGYGDGAPSTDIYCVIPEGYALYDGDCHEGDSTIHPGAAERCDSADVDEDCDGLADDADTDTEGQTTIYPDLDGDGHPAGATDTCDPPSGAITTAPSEGDCDDSDSSVYPGATEGIGDSIDSDCDGDELCYEDADRDGYLVAGGATVLSWDLACTGLGEGDSSTPTGDCDDGAMNVHPSASEVVGDGVDQDCDGGDRCLPDLDLDGYAAETGAVDSLDLDCLDVGEISGVTRDDCDDADPATFPGAIEVVGDELDQDCDGAELCRRDQDGDGYSDPTATVRSIDLDCGDPGELLASAPTDDCDDRDSDFYPGAPETDCTDPQDYDCDGATAYADDDGDGVAACEDCDDTEPLAAPGGAEIPGDGIDGDCDGGEICGVDLDEDGYALDGATQASADLDCDDPTEAAAERPAGDCDDADPRFYPGAEEADCADPNDYDCDGVTLFADADLDGHAACVDCADSDPAVFPGAPERCDQQDEDCDGEIDEDAADAPTWYGDGDGDGFTDTSALIVACTAPAGFGAASDTPDCDDADPETFPGAAEIPGDNLDQDCDGEDSSAAKAGGDCGCSAGAGSGRGAGVIGLLLVWGWIQRRGGAARARSADRR